MAHDSLDDEVEHMNAWDATTYEGKDTILRVVREEADRFMDLAGPARRLGSTHRL